MRICEVTPYSLAQVAGVSAVVASLSREFSLRGDFTLVVAPAPPAAPPLEGPSCVAVSTGTAMRNLALALRVGKVVWKRRGSWDLLHVHQAHPATVAAALVARILGRPVIATFHLQPPQGAGLRGRVQEASTRWAMRVATERTFVSEDTRRDLRAAGQVIPNGVDLAIVRRSLGDRGRIRVELGLGGCVIVFAGRIARIKGAFDLFRALRIARDAGADVQLIMTGQIPAEEQRDFGELLEELGIGPFVRSLGDRQDHLRFLSAGDVFALPSYKEGLPMSMLEAMAAGLPILASPVGGIPEVIQEGREGFLVQPGDFTTLADRIVRLAVDPDLRERMGRQSRERANEFGVDRFVERYLDVFTRAIANRRSRRRSRDPGE